MEIQVSRLNRQSTEGHSNKLWLIPTEFTDALAHFAETDVADTSGNGNVPIQCSEAARPSGRLGGQS